MHAFPPVSAGQGISTEVAEKINASLARFDRERLEDAKDCMKESHGQMTRSIEVTMHGPTYVSYTAFDDIDCGGVHPDDFTFALVYDLRTGNPVNWTRLLPHDVTGETYRQPHRLSIGTIQWPAMVPVAKSANDPECADNYNDDPEMNWTVWLDARKHAIMLLPNLGSHYERAVCGQPVELGIPQAQKLGVSTDLLDALAAAH